MPVVKNKETSARIADYIGYRIFELRLSKKITQQDLALPLQISRVQLCNIEAGRSGVSAEVMFAACTYLECSISDIFPTEHQLNNFKRPSDSIRKAERIKNQIAELQEKLKRYEQ